MEKPGNKYDTSYKKLFANKEITSSLLQGFIPPAILKNMDLATLEAMPTEHITANNRERRNDLLWRLRYGQAWCYLIVMLEFQSLEDRWMAVRISEYSALVLQDAIKYGKLGKSERLPLIFPVVLYNGGKEWRASLEVNQLFYDHGADIDIYLPHQRYYLLDIRHLTKTIENAESNLSAQIFALENSDSVDNIINILANLAKILPEDEKSHIHEAFINLLSVNILADSELNSQFAHCNTVQEAYAMFAEERPRWQRNLLEEGISLGVKESLRNVLSSRFGTLSKDMLAHINKISNTETLNSLLIEAVHVVSLNKFMEKLPDGQKSGDSL